MSNTSHLPHFDNTPIDKETESGFFKEVTKIAFVALLIVLPVRMFIAQPFIVSGSSMDPTFINSDYLIVDQISYRLHDPARQDVIIFRYPKDPSKYFIKRVIGLPGDTVTLEGSDVTITNIDNPEGFSLDEPYIVHEQKEEKSTYTLADNEFFVMGDNRGSSLDSRIWGPLPERFIVGRALVRLLPIDGIRLIPGSVENLTE